MIKNFKELRERVKSSRPLVVSVAAAADTELLLAVKAAVDDGFIQPVLTGDKEKIEDICRQINLVPAQRQWNVLFEKSIMVMHRFL